MRLYTGLPDYYDFNSIFFGWELIVQDAYVFWAIGSEQWLLGHQGPGEIKLEDSPITWEFM